MNQGGRVSPPSNRGETPKQSRASPVPAQGASPMSSSPTRRKMMQVCFVYSFCCFMFSVKKANAFPPPCTHTLLFSYHFTHLQIFPSAASPPHHFALATSTRPALELAGNLMRQALTRISCFWFSQTYCNNRRSRGILALPSLLQAKTQECE